MLIVIEGIDKSGKTTQTNLIKERLKGYKVATFSFPDYSTNIGKEIKAFLNNKRNYIAQVRHLLLAANRWENKDKIESMLKDNDILILNRYYQSNLVYGLAYNLSLEWLEMLDHGLPKEDLTIILDVDIDTIAKRFDGKDLFESNIGLMSKIIHLYRELAKRYGWILINANRSIEEVNDDIMSIINKHLQKD